MSWRSRVLANGTDRDAWLYARRQVVTASDVANILGLGDRSRASVLRAKLSDDTTDAVGELAMVAAGRHLERGLFEWFAAETVHDRAAMCGALIASPSEPFLAGTPDALLDGEPCECKVVGFGSRLNWHEDTSLDVLPGRAFLPAPIATNVRYPPENLRTAKRDEGTPRGYFRDCYRGTIETVRSAGDPIAPLKYWTQLQVQMHLLDCDYGWIVALHGGTSRMDLYYARDRDFEAWMLSELTDFRNDWLEAMHESTKPAVWGVG